MRSVFFVSCEVMGVFVKCYPHWNRIASVHTYRQKDYTLPAVQPKWYSKFFVALQHKSVSSVGIATGYGLEGPGIESLWGARFSAPVQTGSGAHPASCTKGTGSFPGVKNGRGVTLTPHPLLVPWSWKGRAIPLLPLWTVRPVQSLSACTRVTFTFSFTGKIWLRPPDSWGFWVIIWHSHKHTPGGTPLNEWSDCGRAASYTIHNTHSRKTSGVIQPHILINSGAAALRLRPRGHQDRPGKVYMPQLTNGSKRETLFEAFDKNNTLWDEALCIPAAVFACFGETFPSIFRKKMDVGLFLETW